MVSAFISTWRRDATIIIRTFREPDNKARDTANHSTVKFAVNMSLETNYIGALTITIFYAAILRRQYPVEILVQYRVKTFRVLKI